MDVGERAQRYQQVLDTMIEAYYELDVDGKLSFFNDALCTITGYDRSELEWKDLSIFLSPDSAASASASLSLILADERRVENCEWTILRKDGGQRCLSGAILPLLDGVRAIGFFGVARDVTESRAAVDALSDREQRFRDLFDNAPVGYHEVDAEGRLSRVNRTELSMLGYSEQEMVGHHAWEFIVEEISKAAIAAKIAGTMSLAPFERTFRRKDGSRLPVLLEDRLIYDSAGKARGIRTSVFDISLRKQTEEALRESEERYRHLVELSPDAIAVHCEGRILFANGAAAELLGAEKPEDLVGRRAIDLVHPDSRELVRERGRRLREERVAMRLLEHKLLRLDGFPIDVEVAAMPFSYHGKRAIQLVIRDVTRRKVADERVRKLAYHDALTGLPNRILFNDRLTVAIAQSQRQNDKVGLVFIDLDRFKIVNDSFGHSVGDKLLRAAVERIQSCIRKGDTLARIGGDEFTLLLPGLEHVLDAATVAEKVLHALRSPFQLDERELRVSASMGVSVYPDDGVDVESLMKNSDFAMYRAKERGRNNCQLFAMTKKALSSRRPA